MEPSIQNHARFKNVQDFRKTEKVISGNISAEDLEKRCFDLSNGDKVMYENLILSNLKDESAKKSVPTTCSNSCNNNAGSNASIPNQTTVALSGLANPLNELESMTETAGHFNSPTTNASNGSNPTPNRIATTSSGNAAVCSNMNTHKPTGVVESQLTNHRMTTNSSCNQMMGNNGTGPPIPAHFSHFTHRPTRPMHSSTSHMMSSSNRPMISQDGSHMITNRPPMMSHQIHGGVSYSSYHNHPAHMAAAAANYHHSRTSIQHSANYMAAAAASHHHHVVNQQGSRPTHNSAVFSEEESKRVSEEVKRLREKYLITLQTAQEKLSKSQTNHADIKVFRLIQGILENPQSTPKPIGLATIVKIEQHLQKAENIANNINYNLPDLNNNNNNCNNRISQVDMKVVGNENDGGIGNNTSQLLDEAFSKICDQLMSSHKRKNGGTKSLQQALLDHVNAKVPKLKFQIQRSISTISNKTECESEPPSPTEFDITDSSDNEYNLYNQSDDDNRFHNQSNCWDIQGRLRSDLNPHSLEFECLDLETEMKRLKNEFSFTPLVNSLDQSEMTSNKEPIKYRLMYDLDKDLSISKDLVTTKLPSILVTIASDYDDSGMLSDWSVEDLPSNQQEQQLDIENRQFSDLVSNLIRQYFQTCNFINQPDGCISLSHVAFLLKKSVYEAHKIFVEV